jgi:pimeloyl-ACP methyl ester carboxylesterase
MPQAPTLAFDRAGQGEPLVLVHPLGADRGVWEPVIEPLAAEHDVLAMDMPGFGESAELGSEVAPTPEAIASTIIATLESLSLPRAHVAGISLGGWVALEFGKTGHALSATAINPAGFWASPLGPRPEVARRAARRALPLARPLLATVRGRMLALAGTVAHPERVPGSAAYRLVRAYALSPGFERANAEMRRTVFSDLDRVHGPVTLAWSDRDRLVGRPNRDLPGVRMVTLTDCGHVPTWDSPEQVVATILATTGGSTSQSQSSASAVADGRS